MTEDNTVYIDSDKWKGEVLDSEIPVLVDFWADWCGSCRSIAPVLDEIADEFEGRIRIAKVDVDENPDLASEFEVRSIPTLLLIVDGEEEDRIVGLTDKTTILNKLGAYSKVA